MQGININQLACSVMYHVTLKVSRYTDVDIVRRSY